MKFLKNLPWAAIVCFILVPALGICLIACHTEMEHKHFGDGTCHVCKIGQYELFDIEHTRHGGELYYYRCNKCGNLERYESYQGG